MVAPELRDVHEESAGLGRFARISSGALFLFLALVSAISAYGIGAVAAEVSQVVLAFAAMAIASACALWAYRLLLNRPRRTGGLLSPTALRVFAVVYVGLPAASLATGVWRNNYSSFTLVALQGLLYISWGVAMWRLARQRSRHELASPPHP